MCGFFYDRNIGVDALACVDAAIDVDKHWVAGGAHIEMKRRYSKTLSAGMNPMPQSGCHVAANLVGVEARAQNRFSAQPERTGQCDSNQRGH